MQASNTSCHFFFFLNYVPQPRRIFFLFIYFWLHWVFVAARGLSLVAARGGYSSLRCASFSLRWLLLLRRTHSRHVGFSSCGLRALERRLSSCGARAQLLRSMWDLPGPGIEPMFRALAGRLSTTAPPGKSPSCHFRLWLRMSPHTQTHSNSHRSRLLERTQACPAGSTPLLQVWVCHSF